VCSQVRRKRVSFVVLFVGNGFLSTFVEIVISSHFLSSVVWMWVWRYGVVCVEDWRKNKNKKRISLRGVLFAM
jgi:hypothetical protein